MKIIARKRYFHYDFYVNGVRIGKLRPHFIDYKRAYLYFLPNTYDENITELKLKRGRIVADLLDDAIKILQKKMYQFAMNTLEDIKNIEFEIDNN